MWYWKNLQTSPLWKLYFDSWTWFNKWNKIKYCIKHWLTAPTLYTSSLSLPRNILSTGSFSIFFSRKTIYIYQIKKVNFTPRLKYTYIIIRNSGLWGNLFSLLLSGNLYYLCFVQPWELLEIGSRLMGYGQLIKTFNNIFNFLIRLISCHDSMFVFY